MTKVPMHVAMCGPYPYDAADLRLADGLNHAIIALADLLAKTGQLRVSVLSRSPKIKRPSRTIHQGVEIIHLPDPWAKLDYLLSRRLLRRSLGRELQRLRPDIVHAHGEAPFILAAIQSAFPNIVTLHSIFEQQTRPTGVVPPLRYRIAYHMMRRWEREYIPAIHNLIAINDDIAHYFESRAPHARVFRINNTIDHRFFDAPESPASRTVLFVGQISQRKGLHVLLEAFAGVIAQFPGWQLRVIGGSEQDPEYLTRMKQQWIELINNGSISFLGGLTHEELLTEVSQCSFLCLPSLYEASPLVAVEAMAAGKPIVASSVGDLEALIMPSEAGLTCAPGDAQALAEKLSQIMGSPSDRLEMGKRARQVARARIDDKLISQQTLRAYEEIVGS